jgi:hypothetical protein
VNDDVSLVVGDDSAATVALVAIVSEKKNISGFCNLVFVGRGRRARCVNS